MLLVFILLLFTTNIGIRIGPDHVQLRIFNILGKKLIIHSSHLQLIIFILESDSRIFPHNFLSKMKCFDIFQALKMSETLIKHISKNYITVV